MKREKQFLEMLSGNFVILAGRFDASVPLTRLHLNFDSCNSGEPQLSYSSLVKLKSSEYPSQEHMYTFHTIVKHLHGDAAFVLCQQL